MTPTMLFGKVGGGPGSIAYSEFIHLPSAEKLQGARHCVILQGTGVLAPAYYARSLTIGFLTADSPSFLYRLAGIPELYGYNGWTANPPGMKQPRDIPTGDREWRFSKEARRWQISFL